MSETLGITLHVLETVKFKKMEAIKKVASYISVSGQTPEILISLSIEEGWVANERERAASILLTLLENTHEASFKHSLW